MNSKPGELMQGKCKWWSTDRGYGFISGNDGKEYFAHYKEIVGEGRKDLQEGQTVEFEPREYPKGPAAGLIVRL
jgi:cold shock protein